MMLIQQYFQFKYNPLLLLLLLESSLLFASSITTCSDYPNFVDIDGDNCDYYATQPLIFKRCEEFGDFGLDEGFDTANQACCICGGGWNGDEPSLSPSISNAPSGTSSPSEEFQVIVTSPKVECEGSHIDIVGWMDGYHRNCADLFQLQKLSGNFCINEFTHNGYSENTACCYCEGGGIDLDSMIVKEQDGKECTDRADWMFEDDNITCHDLSMTKSSPYACSSFGTIPEPNSFLSAEQACCNCAGGYNGPLIGKTLRVNVIDRTESIHQMFIHRNGTRDGSIMWLMKQTAKSYGFGMYETDLNEVNGTSGDKVNCLRDVYYGNIDICIGTLYNYELASNLLSSEVLSTDDFYLVTSINQESFVDYLIAVGKPFDFWVWFTIICLVFYLGIAFNLVGSHLGKKRPVNGICSILSRFVHITYISIRSFASTDSVDAQENPSLPEKVMVIGFVMFALLIISAYTASVAAFLVSSTSQVEYSSFDAIIRDPSARVCTYPDVATELANSFPSLNIVRLDGTIFDLLDEINKNDRKCTVTVVPNTHYERAVLQNRAYCKTCGILLDDLILSLDNVIYVSHALGIIADEIIDGINSFVENEEFRRKNQYYLDMLRQVNYEIDNLNETMTNNSRYLKGGSGKRDSSLEATSTSNIVCETDPEEEIHQFNFKQLLFPMSATFFCTTLGLVIYFARKVSSKGWQEYQFRKSHVFGKKSITVKSLEIEEAVLESEIEEMLPHEIMEELDELQVDKDLIIAATDFLPDKTELKKLLLDVKLSVSAREFRNLMNLNMFDLYNIYRACCNDSKKNVNHIDDKDNPKKKMIEAILRNSKAKSIAFTLDDPDIDTTILLRFERTADDISSEIHSENKIVGNGTGGGYIVNDNDDIGCNNMRSSEVYWQVAGGMSSELRYGDGQTSPPPNEIIANRESENNDIGQHDLRVSKAYWETKLRAK